MRHSFLTARLGMIVGAAMALALGSVAHSHETAGTPEPDRNLSSVKDNVNLYRIYTGPDERSHVETISLTPRKYNEGRSWIEAGATRVTMGAMPHGLVGDYHPALRRTILIPFHGTVIIDVGDGKTYRLGAGQMVLAEDRTGKGHISTCEAPGGTGQCLIMMVNLKDGEDGLQAGFAAPPPKPNFSKP